MSSQQRAAILNRVVTECEGLRDGVSLESLKDAYLPRFRADTLGTDSRGLNQVREHLHDIAGHIRVLAILMLEEPV